MTWIFSLEIQLGCPNSVICYSKTNAFTLTWFTTTNHRAFSFHVNDDSLTSIIITLNAYKYNDISDIFLDFLTHNSYEFNQLNRYWLIQ